MKKKKRSLRQRMMGIVLLCWLVPVLMMLGAMGWYLFHSVGKGAEEALSQQFQVNLQMCADRLDSAAQASRLASYDPTIGDAWADYKDGNSYASLYRASNAFLSRQYGSDSRFLFSVLWFSENPQRMTITNLTGISGTMYTQAKQFWAEDYEDARKLAEGLDTAAGFLYKEGRLYLVRNLLDSDYQPIGVLVLSLNMPYYFDELESLYWASGVEVGMGRGAVIPLKGTVPAEEGQRGLLAKESRGSESRLWARAALDYGVLLAPFEAYKYMLWGMALLLLPLILHLFRFLRDKVNEPIDTLMEGAGEIERGKLGYQIDYEAETREFQYLTDSFNRMSGQLQNQFNRLYQEELALRDAHIKALQAHINPHFLNNTLEIINWEARMNGDDAVSKMIEALSTVLDAALDRHRNPEVRLAEEMTYVNAYLYIIGQRFGKRLEVSIDLPEELMDCMVPRLILQPVIENAVEHGIAPAQKGTVALRGFCREGYLYLEVENGGGLSKEDEEHIAHLLAADYDQKKETSGNIGIANVNQRLRILYGPECGLTITRGQGTQVVARLKIALEKPVFDPPCTLMARKDNK